MVDITNLSDAIDVALCIFIFCAILILCSQGGHKNNDTNGSKDETEE